jgi:hypothetical protein
MREYTHNRGVPPAAWQGPSLKITRKPTREIYRKDVALTILAHRVCVSGQALRVQEGAPSTASALSVAS